MYVIYVYKINNPIHYEECRFVTLLFEAALGCCRQLYPWFSCSPWQTVGLSSCGMILPQASPSGSWLPWLETGNEVTSPWQTGK